MTNRKGIILQGAPGHGYTLLQWESPNSCCQSTTSR